MANININARYVVRNDTAENWKLNKTQVPLKGELCITMDTSGGPKIKVGDGATAWENLKYINATPEELSAYGVRDVKVTGSGNVIVDASFSEGVLTLTKGTITDNDTLYAISGKSNPTSGADIDLTPTGQGSASSVNVVGGGATTVTCSGGKIVISSTDTDTKYSAKTGTANGTIAFGTPGAEVNITVAGLKSAAYTESTAYDAAGTGAAEAKKVQGNTTSTVKTVEDAAAAAASAASAAQETADSAVEAAETAQSTADNAVSAAATAQSAAEAAQATANAAIPSTEKGANNGVATLDGTGKIPAAQLPASVDEIIEAENFEALPETGEGSKIYVTLDDNKTYRWGGSAYVEISASIALGETTGTAFDGAKGAQLRTDLDAHTANADIHVTSTDKTNWNGKTTMGEVEAKGYQTAAQVKAIKVDNATHADAADNATNLGGQPASYYAPASSIPTVPIQSVVGNNGITASLAGTTVTVGLNLSDVFILNGGNAAGAYA